MRAPSRAAQEERLRKRGDDEAVIARRLALADAEEQACLALADHVVVNDDLGRAIEEAAGILEWHRSRRSQLAPPTPPPDRALSQEFRMSERASMIHPPIEDLLDKVDSKFSLVSLAAKRGRQINSYFSQLGEGLGAIVPPQVASVSRKPLTIALEEIAANKITFVRIEEPVEGEEAPEA